MRYLSIISPQLKQLAVVDLKKPEKLDVIDGIYYAEKFNCTGLLSNYKKPLNEPFKRALKTGEIKLSDLPKKLDTQQALELLESLLKRGKDKAAREMNSASLSNLKTSRPFSKDHQPVRVLSCTPAMLTRARQLRSDGCSWRGIGDILGVKAATIRMAMVRSDKVLKSG
jgi:hypothetical protein